MVFLGPRGARKRAVPANTVDTFIGGRKGDPQHKVVKKDNTKSDQKISQIMKYRRSRSFTELPKGGGGRRPPVKDKDLWYFIIFDMIDLFRPVFCIFDYFQHPRVRKTIPLLLISIIFWLVLPMLDKSAFSLFSMISLYFWDVSNWLV